LKGLGDTKGDTAARTQGATSRRIRSSPHCDREQTIGDDARTSSDASFWSVRRTTIAFTRKQSFVAD
jgi:hypothetical protein